MVSDSPGRGEEGAGEGVHPQRWEEGRGGYTGTRGQQAQLSQNL